MTQISWDTSFITSGSDASFGDDAIRSFLVNVALGLGESLYWPGSADSQGASAASSGELQLGALRFARGGFVQGGFPNGYLSVNTKNVSLFHIGSTWTGTVGHSATLYYATGSGFTFPQASRWLVQEGQFNAAAGAFSSTVTFPTSFTSTPVVFVTAADPHVSASAGTCDIPVIGISSATTIGFTSAFSTLFSPAGSSALTSYVWHAEGIAAL